MATEVVFYRIYSAMLPAYKLPYTKIALSFERAMLQHYGDVNWALLW